MRIRQYEALTIALILTSVTGITHAGVYAPTWESVVVVDTGAIDISSSNGSALGHTPSWSPWSPRDEWHVVYAKAGEIYHAALLPSGWLAPEALTDIGANARDPKLAFARNRLIVVWEDDRRGHPEIWCRMWDGAAWGAEIGLTDDATPSRMPAIAGGRNDSYLVWQDGVDGQTQIYGRFWDGATWTGAANASASPAHAVDPSVCADEYNSEYFIGWTDARHDETEIYLREWSGGFGAPLRVTNLTGSCNRPSLHFEVCCGDVVGSYVLIAFENDQTGHAESWKAVYRDSWIQNVAMVSSNDDRPSERPQPHGYAYTVWGLGATPRDLITWTEAGAPGERRHILKRQTYFPDPPGIDTLSTTGLSTSAVSAVEGSPNAGLLTAWIEERDGQHSLVAMRGSILDCEGFEYAGPDGILLSPGGSPGNTFRCTNRCTGGAPAEGVELNLSFTETLDSHLLWDAQQEHPIFPPQCAGPDGTANVALRGGGCWSGGIARLQTHTGEQVLTWTGARSPDVNGDCAVRDDDLAYVTSRLGMTDFCADLDGSGTVTQADVLIVQAAMGQLCSQIAGVDETTPTGARFQAIPNPSRGEVTFLIPAGEGAPIDVEVVDASGRLLRAWAAIAPNAQGYAWTWDGRDASARDVASGVYFVRARTGSFHEGRTILIAR